MTIIPRNGISGKVCIACSEWKPLTHFKGNGKSADGHDHKCRDCRKYRPAQQPHEWRDGVEGKACLLCQQWKPLIGFPRDKNRPDGRDPRCLDCKRSVIKAYHDDDPKAWNERNRAHYRKHRVARVAQSAKYRQENIERVQAYDRARNRERYIRNPEARQQYSHRRRARIRKVGGTFTASEWRQLKAQYDYTCLCCGLQEPEITLTPDHVIPIARGGRNDIDNIQPLCLKCNLSKATKQTDYR